MSPTAERKGEAMRKFWLAGAVMAAMFAGGPAVAGTLQVQDGWFRALPAHLPAGGYFTLHNRTAKSVTLTGVSSPACGMLMLHESRNEGGRSMMEHVENIAVAPGDTLKFTPGAYHLMCMDPKPAMKPGATVPVTFEFSGDATLKANFAVKNAKGQ